MRQHNRQPASCLTAVLLSGTLALGTLPAPAAFAVEVDAEAEGTSPPVALPVGPESDPDFDPGGDDIALEPAPDDEADGPIEDETLPAPAAETDPSADPATAPEHGALSVAAQVRLIPAKTMPARLAGITSESELVFAPVGMVVPPGPGLQGARPAPSGSTGSGPGSKLQNRIRFCRVKPGGSLWLIAKSLLSEVATDFQVAGKAETLWRLNQDRIGTGSPDLLPVGVRLALR